MQPAPSPRPLVLLATPNSSWLPRYFLHSFGANLCKNPKTRRTSAAAPPLGRHALLHKAAPRGLPRARPLRPVRSLLRRAWGLPMIRGAGLRRGSGRWGQRSSLAGAHLKTLVRRLWSCAAPLSRRDDKGTRKGVKTTGKRGKTLAKSGLIWV